MFRIPFIFIFFITVLQADKIPFRRLSYPPSEDILERQRIFIDRAGEIDKRIKEFRVEQRQLIEDRIERMHTQGAFLQGDTIVYRILVLRVEFQEEDPDDPETTGDGTMRYTSNGYNPDTTIDGCDMKNPFYDPPHNREYYDNLMSALSNYYKIASFGKVKIEWVIKPDGDEETYTLPHPMRYYGDTENWLEGLLALMEDAIKVADEDSTIDFSDLDNNGIEDWSPQDGYVYDRYIIFHAGSAWQTDIAFDTPYDIAAVTVLGYPVFANNRTDTIWDASILPEGMSQDGVEVKLQGTLFHESGHNLFFLPDLYDVEGKGAGIGAWGIMSTGPYLGYPEALIPEGLIPPLPNAWERVWMDWFVRYVWGDDAGFLQDILDTVELSPITTSYDILPSAILTDSLLNFLTPPDDGTRFYKIPINKDEYFLLENKLDNLPQNDSVACPPDTTLVFGEWEEGVVTHFYGENDFLLPGKGLLIWHIDDGIIWDNYYYNSVEAPRPMGVDLEEADGIQDLESWGDYPYDWFGGPFDPFYKDNNDSFGIETNPSSENNGGGNTGVVISNISSPDTLMSFGIKLNLGQEGFPLRVGYWDTTLYYPEYTLTMIERPIEGYINTTEGYIFLLQNIEKDSIIDYIPGPVDTYFVDTSIQVHLVDSIGEVLGSLSLKKKGVITGEPAIYDINNDGNIEVVFGTDEGYLFVYTADSLSNISSLSGFPITLPDAINSVPSVFDLDSDSVGEIAVSADDEKLYIINSDGSIRFSVFTGSPGRGTAVLHNSKLYYLSSDNRLLVISAGTGEIDTTMFTPYVLLNNSSPVICDVNRDGKEDIIVGTRSGSIYTIGDDYNILWEKEIKSGNISPLAVGDIDDDGYPEVTFLLDSELVAVNHLGAFLSGFPVSVGVIDSNFSPTSPVLADIDGDGAVEIVLGVSTEGIVAYNSKGKEIQGIYPLGISGGINSSPRIDNIDSDLPYELVFTDTDGFLYAFELQGNKVNWGGYGSDSRHSFLFDTAGLSTPSPGHLGFQIERIYLYPNPTYDGKVRLRAKLNSSSDAIVQVFSFSGELVKEFTLNFTGGGYEERELNLEELSSGIYYLRCKFRGKITEILKLAIVR